MLILVVVAALAGGTLLGRAIAPNPPQTVRVIQPFVPVTGTETLPSDAREQASVKALFGSSLAEANTTRPAVTITVPKVETPRGYHTRQLAP